MKTTFDILEDFQLPNDLSPSPFGSTINRFANLDEYIRNTAVKIVLRRNFKHTVTTGTGRMSSNVIDLSLSDNPFLREFKLYFDSIYLGDDVCKNRASPGLNFSYRYMTESVDRLKNYLSILGFVFKEDKMVTALDRMKALFLVERLLRAYSIYELSNLSPLSDGHILETIEPATYSVDSFKGANHLVMKQTHPNLCHSFEPFFLLEDEINKIEDGLFDNIKKCLDRILKTGSYPEFVKEAQIFIGTVQSHVIKAPVGQSPVPLFEDEFGNNNTPVDPNAEQSLMGKYKLSCHCHSATNDWRERLIPELMNLVLLMKVAK